MSTAIKVGVCTGLTLMSISPVANQSLELLNDIEDIIVTTVNDQPPIDTALVSWYSMESVLKAGDCGITASGKKFNEEELTFACWHLDFGDRVRFFNPKNGTSVVATCNDRGPAKRLVKQGRLFDLSRAAFSEIANIKLGVIEVEWEIYK